MYIIIIFLLFTVLLLKIGLNIKFKDIKTIKQLGFNKELLEITNKLPNNEQVCKAVLKMLNNADVNIQKEANSRTSLYIVMSNKIIIGNIQDSFTRIQTIVHECIHSIQNKNILKFNFIFSNIYLLYFGIVVICMFFKIPKTIQVAYILLIIQIIISIVHLLIRSYIEIDAMVRAQYITSSYLNATILKEDEKKILSKKYEELNNVGIKLYVFILSSKCILRTLLYSIIILIRIFI